MVINNGIFCSILRKNGERKCVSELVFGEIYSGLRENRFDSRLRKIRSFCKKTLDSNESIRYSEVRLGG